MHFGTSIVAKATGMLTAMTLLCGVAYPLTMTAVAQAAFPHQANGSLISMAGTTRGSSLIGQSFDGREYFWGRLSATSAPYDATASSGSNLGPTNDALTKAAQARVDALRAADPTNAAAIPVDLVTSSGSGLDPHISPAAAEYQVRRVARARALPESTVRATVAKYTERRSFGLLGEARVNVLALNLALDELREGR